MTIRKLCDSVCYNWHILPWQLPVQATRMGWACSAAHIPGSYGAKESEVREVSKECTHVMKHHGFFLAWPFDTNKMTIHDHIPYWVIKKNQKKDHQITAQRLLDFFWGGAPFSRTWPWSSCQSSKNHWVKAVVSKLSMNAWFLEENPISS